MEIKDKKGTENLVADHLSILDGSDKGEKKQLCINDKFLDEQLLAISSNKDTPWFTDIVNYLVENVIPPELSYQQKKKFFVDLKHYYWEDFLFFTGFV